MTSGLCGNFDDDKENDMVTKDGTYVGGRRDRFRLITDSWNEWTDLSVDV